MAFTFVKSKKVLWNPTPYPMTLEFNKQHHLLEPFGELETSDDVFIKIMLQDYGKKGLVCLSEEEKGRTSFEDYKTTKELEGLRAILRFKQQNLADETFYVQQLKTKTNIDKEAIITRVPIYEKDIAYLSKAISSIYSNFKVEEPEEYTIPERKEWREKELKKGEKKSSSKIIDDILDDITI